MKHLLHAEWTKFRTVRGWVIGMLVAIPLTVALGAEWGATGAAVAVLLSTLVFAGAWVVVLVRLRAELRGERGSSLGGAVAP